MKNKKAQAAMDKLKSVPLTASADIEITAAADGEAKQPSFVIDAYNGGSIQVSAFFRPVVIDLAGVRANRVTILRDHDPEQIVGQGTAKITKKNITVKGNFTGDPENENDPTHSIIAHSKNGFVWSASVGVGVDRMEFVDAGESVKVNGQKFNGPIGIVRAGRLGEVSFVGIGADETASATIAAQAANMQEKQTMNEFNEWVKAMGLDPDDLTEDQQVKLQAKYDAEQVTPPPVVEPEPDVEAKADEVDPLEAGRLLEAAEVTRVADIRKICGEDHAELCATAILKGHTVEATELAVLKAERPKTPAVHDSVPVNAGPQVIEAAVMMGSSLNVEGMYDDKVLEAASKYRGGMGIGEMLLAMAEDATGRRFAPRDLRSRTAEVLRAAFSTQSLTGILSNIANKFLLAGYEYGDNSDLAIASKRSVNDFKQITSYRMTGNSQFVEVAPSGEIQHGTLSEDTYNNQAKTYGIMYALTRTDIINDDLGAFDQLQTIIGQGAAHKRRAVVWAAFMDNSDFFKTANSNIQSGASSALSVDSLTSAEQLFMDQTDVNGQPIGIMPKLLVVPTALAGTAKQIFQSAEIRDTTASTKTPIANIQFGKFDPIVSTYLGNSSFTGYSAASWYMLADPQALSTIEVCYLNGVEVPTIETADADFNTLGVQMRGYFDFGVALQDPKGGVKSVGS
jgi:phage head maturation protease